jgi:lipoate-protein ligase A
VPPLVEIKRAIAQGFEKVFGMQLRPGGLLREEEVFYRKGLPYFESEDWIYLERRAPGTAGHVNSVRKTPGGLVRVSLSIDTVGEFIVSSFITGDFQVFPQRAIMDLEARLKNLSTDDAAIRDEVRSFFDETAAKIAGIEPDDLADIILEAVKKKAFVQLGVTLDETNHLMPVNFPPDEICSQTFDYVLLPYCAKLVGCDYRRTEGCTNCSECTVGDVKEVVEKIGLPVRTIQNFEHLMETIEEFKKKGARGFVGSCCEGFFCKHHDDFVGTGVPALLVDVDDSTCYELGEEREAYLGEFESQTNLKTDLLTRVLTSLSDRGVLRGL